MSDTLMAIIGIFIAAILMFMFPLLEFAQRNDEIAQTTVHMAVSDFVDKATTKGEITKFDYDEMVQKIYATGNSYDIQIEAQIIDDNPRRKTTTGNNELLGEYKYYSVYTQEIISAIDNNEKGNKYELKNDDYLIVTVKNTSLTLATQLKNVFYRITGRESYEIGTSVSSIVLNGSTSQIKPKATLKAISLLPDIQLPEPTPATPSSYTQEYRVTTSVKEIETNVVLILDCAGISLPYHVYTDGMTTQFINDMVRGFKDNINNCNIDIILNGYPNTIFSATEVMNWNDRDWRNIVRKNMSFSMAETMQTAINRVNVSGKNRVIVYISFGNFDTNLNNYSGYDNWSAVQVLINNRSSYDYFYTAFCCDTGISSGQWPHPVDQEMLINSMWHPASVGGYHVRGGIGAATSEMALKSESIGISGYTDAKIQIIDYNKLKGIEISLSDGTSISVGKSSTSVLYYDSTTAKYVLDIMEVYNSSGKSYAAWNNAKITIEYEN